MKKILLTLVVVLASIPAFAQFERDTYYINTSLTNFGLSYSGAEKMNFGVNATGGLFIEDCWAAVGEVGIDYTQKTLTNFSLGAGIRYYILQNGIYLGAGAQYNHDEAPHGSSVNDLRAKVEIGYAYYLNHYLTVEPAIYYNQSFKDQDYSKFGVKIGFGYYF